MPTPYVNCRFYYITAYIQVLLFSKQTLDSTKTSEAESQHFQSGGCWGCWRETGGEVMNGVSCPNGSKLSKKMEWRGLGWQMSCPTLQIPHHMNAPLLPSSSSSSSNSAVQCSELSYGFTLWQNQLFGTFAPNSKRTRALALCKV